MDDGTNESQLIVNGGWWQWRLQKKFFFFLFFGYNFEKHITKKDKSCITCTGPIFP